MNVKLTIEQRALLLEIYPKIKTGQSDNLSTTNAMVRLHNDIFGTRYKPNTSCVSCVNIIWRTLCELHNYEQDKE
jgi:hypothetical protein